MKNRLFYNNIVFRLLAPPLFGAMIYLLILMFFDSIDMLTDNFFSREVMFTISISFLFFELNRLVIILFNHLFLSGNKLQLRIGLQYLTAFVITALAISGALYAYFVYIEGFSTINTELVTFNSLFLFVAVFYHLFFFSLVYLNRKNDAKVEKEITLKANLDAEFQTYKNQINPNLLFQSLEIIISELHNNKKSADDLINKLSKVYRYALDNKHNDLVTVKEELESLYPLASIYETKYPSSFELNINVGDEANTKTLVPGSLQTLLEKALSENIITPELKLKVSLTNDNNRAKFTYTNNPKITAHGSQNDRYIYLKKAYGYFSNVGLTEDLENGMRTISLPLLEVEEE